MKLINFKKELFLNNKIFLKNYQNSIYDILIKNNLLYIPDYKNNKLVIFNILQKRIEKEIFLKSPHSIICDNNKYFIVTYRNKKIYEFCNLNISKKFSNKFFYNPISIAKSPKNILIINWSRNIENKVLLFDSKFNFLKRIIINQKHISPHYVIFKSNFFYLVNHNVKNPKIFVLNINGVLVDEITNKYIKNPVSIKYHLKNFFICDYKTNSLNIFNNNFELIYKYKSITYPMNVAFHRNKIFVCEEFGNRIVSFDIVYE